MIAVLQFLLVVIAYGDSTSHSPDGVGYSVLLGEDEPWEEVDSDAEGTSIVASLEYLS